MWKDLSNTITRFVKGEDILLSVDLDSLIWWNNVYRWRGDKEFKYSVHLKLVNVYTYDLM